MATPNQNTNYPNRTTFAYTGTGRLATYAQYTGGSISLQGTYTYDAQGQRTKSVVGPIGGLTTTTQFSYQDPPLQRLSVSHTVNQEVTDAWKITYLYDNEGPQEPA